MSLAPPRSSLRKKCCDGGNRIRAPTEALAGSAFTRRWWTPGKPSSRPAHCGVSTATVHQLISAYNRRGVAAVETPGKGGRRNQYLTLEQEQQFLAPFFAQAQAGSSATAAQIKQALNQWRAGFPVASVGDSDAQIVEGRGEGKTRIKLFFDQKTGLLLRQLRYSVTLAGTNPIQIDYADYRDVGGAKLPFRWTVTWTNGQSTYEIGEIQAGVPIDDGKFSKPAPAVVKPAKKAAQ